MNQLDDKDRMILECLKRDSRSPAKAIAKELDMRPSTVHERIRRLRESEVISSFTIKVDPEKLGKRLTVFMLVSGSMEEYLDQALLNDPRVEEVHGITGEYDLLIKLRLRDMRDFNSFIIQFRKKYSDHLVKTITMVETAKLKIS